MRSRREYHQRWREKNRQHLKEIRFWLLPEEKAKIASLAAQQGVGLSEWMRKALLSAEVAATSP